MIEVMIKIVGVVLTLCVLSRIIWVHNNPLFRFAQYLFVGVSLGYAFVVLYHQVLWPAVFQVSVHVNNTGIMVFYLMPFVLGLLLLPRIAGQQQLSWLANLPLALLFGVGTALALGGVLVGTLLPQVLDTIRLHDGSLSQVLGTVFLAIGVILTLSYFFFTVRADTGTGRFLAAIARAGYWLLMVAFGFFFAGALRTYLAALIERLNYLIDWNV